MSKLSLLAAYSVSVVAHQFARVSFYFIVCFFFSITTFCILIRLPPSIKRWQYVRSRYAMEMKQSDSVLLVLVTHFAAEWDWQNTRLFFLSHFFPTLFLHLVYKEC